MTPRRTGIAGEGSLPQPLTTPAGQCAGTAAASRMLSSSSERLLREAGPAAALLGGADAPGTQRGSRRRASAVSCAMAQPSS